MNMYLKFVFWNEGKEAIFDDENFYLVVILFLIKNNFHFGRFSFWFNSVPTNNVLSLHFKKDIDSRKMSLFFFQALHNICSWCMIHINFFLLAADAITKEVFREKNSAQALFLV